MSTSEHHVAGQTPKPHAWDYPLTAPVLIVLAMAAVFVVALAVAGMLP